LDVLILFIIALGLAMNCFGLAIANSSLSGKVVPGIPLKTSLAFSLSHFVFAFAGYYLGRWAHYTVEGIEGWSSFLILMIIGVKLIMEAWRKRPETKVFDINNTRVIFALSVATGMNALMAGLVLGIMSAPILLATFLIAITVFVFTLSGLAGGQNLGLTFAKRVTIFGGAFLIVAGFRLLLEFIF
jgi:putative Mn2+ efflux pump MntP